MRAAVARYEALDVSDEELVRRYRHLVDRVARKVAWHVGDPDLVHDLWGVGAMGLIEAAGRFDPGRSVRFEVFAEFRIRGAMIDELRRMDRFSRRLRSRSDLVVETRRKLTQALQREPTVDEVARAAKTTCEEVEALESMNRSPLPLELLSLSSTVETPEEQLLRSDRVATLARAVATLPDRDQTLLSLYYVEGLTYREIAKIFGVSEPRISQLRGRALRRLREALEAIDAEVDAGLEAGEAISAG